MGRLWSALAWLTVVGGLCDGAIAAFAAYELVSADAPLLSLSVDAHLKTHLPWLYWVRPLAFAVLPDGLAAFVFDLPALVYFPARAVVSAPLGWLFFRLAGR
ncbi:MAG: hypothetical protein AAGC56_12860 [Pseudomonadota bacterium]